MNRHSSIKDVSMQRTPAGGGHTSPFLCPLCAKPRLQIGRRLRLVRGCKTWVCAGCAK